MPGVSSADQKREAFEMESLAWSFFSDTSGSTGQSNEFCSDNTGGFAGRVDDGAGNVNLLVHDLSGGYGVSEFGDVNCCSEGLMFDCGGGFDNGQRDHGGGSFGGGIGNNSLNALVGSARLEDVISALQKYLPSNNEDESSLTTVDAYSCDEFRMYEFKVRRCMRGRSHDWTECPFAHPGEKARRRDPRRFHYSGTACPDFRKGSCRRGDSCEFAHGVFECWLHPARYRTQPCKDGRNCRRRVCFFAHTPEQLRLLPSAASPQSNGGSGSSSRSALHASALKNSLSASYDGSPRRQMVAVDGSSPSSPRGYLGKAAQALLSSPTSTLVGHSHSPPPLSPPLSPSLSPPDSPNKWLNAAAAAASSSVGHRISSPARGALQKTVLSTSSLAQVQSLAGNHTLPFIQTSSISVPGHRRHLDRMASMPTITLPCSPSSLRPPSMFSDGGGSQPSSPVTQSPVALAEMLNSLQSLDINSVAATSPVLSWHGSPRASNLRHCFNSDQASCSSKSSNADIMEDLFEEPVQRVESGRGLRAEIYGRLTKENSVQEPAVASEAPDLGWVNELVK